MSGIAEAVPQDILSAIERENFEFRRLRKQHEELEQRLVSLDSKRYLSVEEQLERKTLQKRKLLGKDRMFEILRSYRNPC